MKAYDLIVDNKAKGPETGFCNKALGEGRKKAQTPTTQTPHPDTTHPNTTRSTHPRQTLLRTANTTMDIQSIRISIIGNRDLKYKLTKNDIYINDIINELSHNISNTSKLADGLTIINFLLKFDPSIVKFPVFLLLRQVLYQVIDNFTQNLINSKLSQIDKSEYLVVSSSIDLLTTIQGQFNSSLLKFVLLMLSISGRCENLTELTGKTLDLIPVIRIDEIDQLLIEKLVQRLGKEVEGLNVKLIYKLILSLNFLLNSETGAQKGVVLDEQLKNGLKKLINHGNQILNLNIISLLYVFDKNDVKDYMNRLMELIEFNQFSINPFEILSNMIIRNDSLVVELVKFKIDIKLVSYLKSHLKTFTLNEMVNNNVSDILLLISLLTHNNEEIRGKFISKFNFKPMIKKLCSYYKSSLIQMAKNIHNEVNDVGLVNDKIFTNCLNFVRALSRSITLLRTFFVDLDIIDTLIDILFLLQNLNVYSENMIITLSIFANLILNFSSFRYNLVNNDKFFDTLLAIFDYNTLNSTDNVYREQINLIFLQIEKNVMYNENEENKIKLIDKNFKLDYLVRFIDYNEEDDGSEIHSLKIKQKLTSFDIIRNLSSNSNYFNYYLSQFFSTKLNINWYDLLTKNIMNLSNFDKNLVKFNAPNLLKLMNNDDYVGMILSINYIESHRILTINDLHLNRNFLVIWLIFLNLTPSKHDNLLKCSVNLNSIKTSIIWVLLNLTWQDRKFDIRLFDDLNPLEEGSARDLNFDIDYQKFITSEINNISDGEFIDLSDIVTRAEFLKTFGFIDSLKKFNQSLTKQNKDGFMVNDILEKSSTVLHQVEGILAGRTRSITRDAASGSTTSPARATVDRNPALDMTDPGAGNSGAMAGTTSTSATAVPVPGAETNRNPWNHTFVGVNRGGEGFGYDSDDYVDAEDAAEQGDHTQPEYNLRDPEFRYSDSEEEVGMDIYE